MKPTTVAALALAGLVLSGPAASHPKIGVFFDPEGRTCGGEIRTGSSGVLYVLALLDEGPVPGEIIGAEFRITGLPPSSFGFAYSFFASNGGTARGNPTDDTGAMFAFSECHTGTRIFEIGRISYNALLEAPPDNTVLEVTAMSPPSNRLYACPVIVECLEQTDCGPSPYFPRVCAEGLTSVINGTCTVDAQGTIGPASRLAVWPNPAREGASLRFELPRSGDVQLQVYDLGGREVRRVFQGPAGAGFHVVAWDGRDEHGARVASGVYFVRLLGPGGAMQRRVTMLR